MWSSLTTSYDGFNYFILFIYDFSWKVWIKFLKSKGETFETFKHFMIEVENFIKCHIKVLLLDDGLEYKSKEFELFCKEKDMLKYYTNLYDPQ